ncbi:hypothetical protein I317_02192 [Kwoniella heveanensis CBS 569]|nr:hypothetical protein I317_02192 [Kwoniella heveanensis CBS 569]
MNIPTPLSPLADPVSLSKIPILFIPVHNPSTPISQAVYSSYLDLIKRYQTLRGDELSRPHVSRSRNAGGADLPPNPRLRFFPPSTGNSISVSRGATTNHVHLEYVHNPPAQHLYPLSLLRMAGFPLIVLGLSVEPDPELDIADDGHAGESSSSGGVRGYSLEESTEEEDEGSGDITDVPTPTAPTFRREDFRGSIPSPTTSTSRQQAQRARRPVDPDHAFSETISSIFPSTSPFPLVKRLLVVPNQIPRSPSSPRKQGSVPVPSGRPSQKDKGYMRYAPSDGVGSEGWLGRVLGEVVGELLGELGEIATALETPAGMRTLSSTLLPSLTATLPHPELNSILSPHRSSTPNEYPSRPSSSTPVNIPHSASLDHLSGMGISLTRSLTPGGRPTSIQPPSLPPMPTSISPAPQPAPAASSNPFRRSTALSSPFSRTSSAASTTSSSSPVNSTQIGGPTKYTNATLSGVAGGRLMKLLGDFYLLAGLYGDAIRCFDDGAERCRSVGDVLWEGAAREGRAVAGIGEAWEGRDGSNLAQPFPTSPIPVEILSHYLSSLACLSRSPLPYPPTILSPSPQAVSGSISFPASSTFNPSNVGTGEGLLAYLHTGLSLRITHFVLLIWAAGGWGSIALSSLMTHTLPRSFPPPLQSHETTDLSGRRRRHRSLALLSATSQLSRQSVFAHVEQALGPHHRAMTKTEQLTIHTEAIWLARWLDLPRKESAITRDVIKRLAILIVEGREENRRMGAAGFSRTKMATPTSALLDENKSDAAAAAVGLGLGLPVASQNVAIRRKESTEGNSGIVALFERACQVMGIDLLSFDHDDFATSSHKHTHSITQHDSDSPSSTTKREPRFGWPELQVELLKDGITVSESLPDHPSIIRLALSALNGLHGYLNPQSQGMLSKMYPSALATARRRGMDIGGMPWWIPGKIVLSIEVSGLSPNKVPIQHSREEIAIKEGKKDPFLYNPRLKAAEGGTTVIVANEQIDVFVTVRNPFTFDLEIQDLSILTSGVPFITSPLPLTLPGSSIQTVRVTGHSPTPGSMQIKGISIRLNDGASTEILIPIMDVSEKQKRDKRKSRIQTDLGKVKRQGLDARFAILEKVKENDGEAEVFEGAKWIECKVVDELPLAWIKRTTLTHGTVMLYHGETSVIRITLENASSVPIDFVKLTFDDSTAREAAAIIQEGELTPEQAYEIEWDQLKRPVFVWERDDKEQTIIPPGGRTTLSVRCLGKVGCTDGTIRIDYGCINRRSRPRSSIDSQTDGKPVKAEEAEKTFYTRQISFPILFTVYHMLECPSLDLVRLGGSSGPSSSSQVASRGLRSAEMNGRDVLRQVLEEENDSDHCLLALSVKNIFGVPFEVTLARKADEKDLHQRLPLACTRLVPPGATERLIISLPRQSIPQSDLSQPIPSLSERQYIVDKEKKSVSRLHRERELFWYREKLLDLVSASWQEPGSNRRGTLSLRDQYFASDLLQVLKSDGVEVNVTLTYDNGAKNIQAMDFVGVSVKITNKLERPFRPYIHLAPLPSSHSDTSWAQAPSSTHHPSSGPGSASARPNSLNTQHQYQNQNQNQGSKNVLFDGLSSAALDDVLESGQTAEWTLGACFLVSGDYGLRAAVEEHGAQDDKEEEEEDGSTLNKGKKIWFSDVLNVRVD